MDLAVRRYAFPSLSSDGRQLTVSVAQATTLNVWAGYVDGELTQLTTDGFSTCSMFSPDGRWVYFGSAPTGGWPNLFRTLSDRSLPPERLLDTAAGQKPTSLSRDGTLLFNEAGAAGDRRIMQMNVERPGSRVPFGTRSGNEIEAAISPDGKWVAYQSDESGQWQIYVRPYPGPGARRQVSIDEGMGPVWNPRGDELFYQTRTALMSVHVVGGVAKWAADPAVLVPKE